MAWHNYYFILILIGLYLGAIVTAAFNEKLSTTLMMVYLGGLFVVVLATMAWFAFMLVVSDPVGIAVTVAAAFVAVVVVGLTLGMVDRMKRKR
jgi:hypothetical protein